MTGWLEDHPYLGLAAVFILAAFFVVVAAKINPESNNKDTWEVESARK